MHEMYNETTDRPQHWELLPVMAKPSDLSAFDDHAMLWQPVFL